MKKWLESFKEKIYNHSDWLIKKNKKLIEKKIQRVSECNFLNWYDFRVEVANGERELNHYQHIDQALRTVTTQLLNVSGTNDGAKENPETEPKLVLLPQQVDKKISQHSDNKNENKNNNNMKITNINNEKNDVNIVKKIEPEVVSIDSAGRPVNAKYHYMHVTNPGQAMALTDEELEIELASTRSPSFYRKPPVPSTTTAGGISTWVQVNPPKTTPKPLATTEENEDNNIPTSTEQITTQTSKSISSSPVETESTLKTEVKTTTTVPKIPAVQTTPKVTVKKSTTAGIDLSTTTTARSISDSSTTLKSSAIIDDDDEDSITTTKKISSSSRNSSKSRPTTPKSTTISAKTTTIKLTKPTPSRQSKPSLIRKPSNKNDVTKSPLSTIFNSTSKIEKVTYKPMQIITTPKSPIETMQNPVFIKKIHASFHTDNPSTINDLQLKNENSSLIKSKLSKPQLKKPIDTPTTIEIEPIKVNAPVLHIEKVEDKKKYTNINNKDKIKDSMDGLNLENSQIDVKFDFNPDAMKIEIPTEITTKTVTTTTMASTTSTKKPKDSSKRKKHKTRRRKPSSSSSSTTAAAASSDEIEIPSVTEILEEIAQNVLPMANIENSDNTLQESKVVPDTKTQVNNNKNKKQVAKPIGTQIYNYFSREVMPSFGVMSLVGIGLGLASYFLYPFGGVIARRNDEVGTHYNYNIPSEHGNIYEQKEEEVFSKVLQGMSPGDNKYGGIIDYEKNHYRYNGVHGESYTTTKKNDVKYQTSQPTNYRLENTPLPYEIKYRNTEFKYPDLITTPKYYEHQQKQSIDHSQNHRHVNYGGPIVGSADRQFVVGSIPKEYSKNEENVGGNDNKNLRIITTTESMSTDFEKQIAQSMKFLKNPLENLQTANAQPLRADGFDEVDITPAAVAVEHGPRSLKLDDLLPVADVAEKNDGLKKRIKRDSVIQLIPTKSEIEKDEHQEDLSNEIFNIIDSALPPDNLNVDMKKNHETTDKPREELTTSTTKVILKTKEIEVEENSSTGTTTIETVTDSSEIDPVSPSSSTTTEENSSTSKIVETFSTGSGNTEPTTFGTASQKPNEDFGAFNFVKKIAEVKFRLGLTILKRASESFAKYLGHVQKRLNGEE